MRRWLLIGMLPLLALPVMAQQPSLSLLTPMVADISQERVEIHSSFTGLQLLVFGARNQPGDLVVVARGPVADVTLRRKERIAGMWMHTDREKYTNLPLFYGYASTRPLERVAPASTLRALGIGGEEVVLNSNSRSRQLFTDALEQHMERYRVWQLPFGEITFFGETLFKAKIDLPDRLPRGQFTVEVYLFERGQLIGFQTIPMLTYKTGFDARVYDTAQGHTWLYGIVAILMALAGGWLAHRLFHRKG